ncbi:hypothetical protein N431DRAFT_462456 [Stipitochalara longipes BDJ]|nr:hypothetical protein N431DRAFT_462456 [Stipitochalara longipes BDJ]
MDELTSLEYFRARLCQPTSTMESSTSNAPTAKPFFLLGEPRLKINPSHPPELVATIQRHNNLEKFLDPAEAVLFQHLPPELRVQTWKEAFATWSKSQRRIRIVIPASPVVSNKVICDEIKDLSYPHPNFLSDDSGFATEICPLFSVNFEARKVALEQFTGSLDICSCVKQQCYQCRDMGMEWLGAHECNCKQLCTKRCGGKTYFTADQIFYIPGFATISSWIEVLVNNSDIKRFYKNDDKNNPLDWASKLQNVALEAHHLAGQPGQWIKTVLSKFKRMKKLYIIWRFDPRDGINQSFITQYASEDNDKKIILTPEAQLDCLKQTFFESPDLWLNQLSGLETEFIYVPVKLSVEGEEGHALSSDIINESVQALEDYFTPGNHARKMAEEKRKLISENIVGSIAFLQHQQRERELFLERKERNLMVGEQKRAEFRALHGIAVENDREDD